MKYRFLPQSNLKVSSLIYGCMNIGGPWSPNPPDRATVDNALACVRTAVEGGINVFDHADIYGGGRSEEVFSAVWSELGLKRSDVIIQSKCGIRRPGEPNAASPHRFDFSFDHIVSSVDGILRRLKTDRLDILLLHRPDPLADPDEVARAFDHLRSNRMVHYFGVSNHNAAQIALLQRAVGVPLVANQLEFNLLHSDLIDEGVTVNDARQRATYRADGTLDYCRLNGISVQAYSPVAKGRLALPKRDDDERIQSTRQAVEHLAHHMGVSGEAVLLAWILRHPAKILPVIGTTRPDRITASLDALKIEMTREEWYSLYLAGRGRDLP
ncbi:MAG TPA: aldo/keto reductase [Bacteroidetes bacterium]|nr:MAG: hypothetical protein A2X68_01720 [Ignavibacteria bacterium GWC2_56_12]HAV23806.1 aldo/keto reductase [Bacteroidota bacterium]